MTEISLETVAGKLNRLGYDAFLQSLRLARGEGNRNLELSHWFRQIVQQPRSDVSATLAALDLDRARLLRDLDQAIAGLRKNATEMPGVSDQVTELLDRGWHHATLMFAEVQIRTGHLLVAALKSRELRRGLVELSRVFADIPVDRLIAESRSLWRESDEEALRPMDGSGLTQAARPEPGGSAAPAGATTALARFSVDMTAQAAEGALDPVLGRDDEIRQLIDVLQRRRQNNPILTGEAGVGKTAVVEGFAQRLASGDVPPALRGVRLHALDIGLLQAGASMKGEFEQRLRSVIDEVQSSPVPVILFIDEAHTLIGAGGAAGTGDAANLLKPALARGKLRTIAATTWAEYRMHFEKDPALTRRFQPVDIREPDVETCCIMLRGALGPMESHHGVRISDEALVAAVTLSARYIPARQLPDKAVSLLDTAAARVAISQSTRPARMADLQAQIAALTAEIAAKEAMRELGEANPDRIAEALAAREDAGRALREVEADYAAEKALVEEIIALRGRRMTARAGRDGAEVGPGEPGGGEQDAPFPDVAPAPPANPAEEDRLADCLSRLEATDPDRRMVYAHVDAQAVASVISDWTGIPAGRMMADELTSILTLADRLKDRVVGQDHALEMIARRIQTASARLANPEKPIGVFMLCGPSGVGKTETALALAEAVYGGDQNIITINMSEFQEAHSVSLLKGAPPGYVGYGEGGRLTEAVRRKPYSVILLDEIEKAHPDVHELFFQVFDKGVMEDGAGRSINFRNTMILLTSNVGTEAIMEMAEQGATRPDPEALSETLRPWLLQVFPPALLGRIVTIPYFPLSAEVLSGIVRLKLAKIVRQMKANHGAVLTFSDEVLDHIVAACQDPDSGGRMVDNIITNTILPGLSREVLARMAARAAFGEVTVGMGQDGLEYRIS